MTTKVRYDTMVHDLEKFVMVGWIKWLEEHGYAMPHWATKDQLGSMKTKTCECYDGRDS